MAFIGPWEILVLAYFIPAIIVSFHSDKHRVPDRWIWILITIVTSLLGLIIYLVVYSVSCSKREEAGGTPGILLHSPSAPDTMKSYCPNCGALNEKTWSFCHVCGKSLTLEKLTKEELIRSATRALDQGDKELARKFMDQAESLSEDSKTRAGDRESKTAT